MAASSSVTTPPSPGSATQLYVEALEVYSMYSDVFSMYRMVYVEALFLFSMYRSLYIECRELAVAFSLGAIEAPLLAIEGTSLYIEYGESASMYSAPGSMYAQGASMYCGLRMARAAGWVSGKGLPVGEKSSRASGRLSRWAGSETGMDGADGDIESPRRWIMDRRELLLSPLAYMPPPQLLAGLESDLSKKNSSIDVKIFVVPRGI